MPTPTYTPLANVTLASTTSSVTFGSIPATYRDLILVFEGTVSTTTNVLTSLNGDTSTVYTRVQMTGSGSSASSSSGTHEGLYTVYGQSGERVFAQLQIFDYSATDKHKTALSRGHTSGAEVAARALRWPSTAAVVSLAASSTSGTFNTGCTFSLYGVIA